MSRAERNFGKALDSSGDKHRQNAKDAREAAAAITAQTPEAAALRRELIKLSKTELNLAAQADAARDFGATIQATTSQLGTLYNQIRNPPAFSIPGGLTAPVGSGPGKKVVSPGSVVRLRKSQEVNPASKVFSEDAKRKRDPRLTVGGSPVSLSDVVDAAIDARHRDDSLEDKRTIASSNAASAAAGITNPDKIAAAADLAVTRERKKEIDQDAATVRKASARVNGKLVTNRSQLARLYASLKKTPRKVKSGKTTKDNPAYERLLESISKKRDAIRSLIDEKRALIRQAADLQADAAELGYDIATLADQVAQMPNVPPPADTDTSSASTDATPVSTTPTPDAQAQIDQSNALVAKARAEFNASDAAIRALLGPGGPDAVQRALAQDRAAAAGVGGNIVFNIAGSVIQERNLADSVVEAMSRQPYIRRSVFSSGA